MTGTRRNALAADSPTARMLRTIDDRRGTTNPRSIMCLVASAVAAAVAVLGFFDPVAQLVARSALGLAEGPRFKSPAFRTAAVADHRSVRNVVGARNAVGV